MLRLKLLISPPILDSNLKFNHCFDLTIVLIYHVSFYMNVDRKCAGKKHLLSKIVEDIHQVQYTKFHNDGGFGKQDY